MIKKKICPFKFNIFIKDSGKEGNPTVRGFNTQEEAEKFIEEHDRPNDLTCEFDPNYAKRLTGEGG